MGVDGGVTTERERERERDSRSIMTQLPQLVLLSRCMMTADPLNPTSLGGEWPDGAMWHSAKLLRNSV